jgi:divalent metal cation (Fe/Co/Zn/Cd) transporter
MVKARRRGNVVTYSVDDHDLAALFREAEYHADHVRHSRPDHPYLMDGVDPADLRAAHDAVMRVEGVSDVTVRGRWMGRSLVLDIEARLNADISLETAEGIGSRARSAVFDAVPSARRLNWIPRA